MPLQSTEAIVLEDVVSRCKSWEADKYSEYPIDLATLEGKPETDKRFKDVIVIEESEHGVEVYYEVHVKSLLGGPGSEAYAVYEQDRVRKQGITIGGVKLNPLCRPSVIEARGKFYVSLMMTKGTEHFLDIYEVVPNKECGATFRLAARSFH